MFNIRDYLNTVLKNIKNNEIKSTARELLTSLPADILKQDFEEAGLVAFDMMAGEDENFSDSIGMQEFMYSLRGAEMIFDVIDTMAEDYY